MVITKIKIDGKKNSDLRSIDVYFKKQKWPVRVMIDKNETSKKGIIIPAFFIWVDKTDDNYEIRKKLCIWLYKRFWIYLHKIDKKYDEYVNGNFENSYSNETDKWTYQEFYSYVYDRYYNKEKEYFINKHNIKFDLEFSLKEMYDLYNKDVDNNFYKYNFGKLKY